jgi:hypothetical protein
MDKDKKIVNGPDGNFDLGCGATVEFECVGQHSLYGVRVTVKQNDGSKFAWPINEDGERYGGLDRICFFFSVSALDQMIQFLSEVKAIHERGSYPWRS